MRPASLTPALVLLLLAAAAAPQAQAALNGAKPYQADHDYMPGLEGPTFTMASGRMDAVIPDGEGTWGFFATGGATLSGLTRVCWTDVLRECADSTAGELEVDVKPGGSFGLQFPDGADAALEASHALAMFVDLSETGDVNTLGLGLSLLAPAVEGSVTFSAIPEIPASLLAVPTSAQGGSIVAAESSTVLEVREGETVHARLEGKVDPVTFAGRPALTRIATELAVVPFAGNGAVARFDTAEKADAEVGLDVNRINRLMQRLYDANQGEATQGDDIDEGAFGPFQGAVGPLFGGAVLSLPSQGTPQDLARSFEFARTPHLEVRGTTGGLSWTGRATLDVRDGHVQGAQPLYGIGIVALPWWGWLLWAIALTVWILRLVRKPEKKNARWDPYKWVGWVASAVVFLLVFFLWDLEMRAVLGLSLLSGTGLPAQFLVVLLLLQVGTLGLLSFAAIAPLRLALRNGSLLAGQGTFMGLAGAVAGILGFLIGAATMLRSGLDLVISQLLSNIA